MEFADTDKQEVRRVLEEKILVCCEYVCNGEDDVTDADERSSRKRIVYYTTISFLAEHGQKAVDKIRRNLDIFAHNAERIDVTWVNRCGENELALIDRTVADDFVKEIEKYKKSGAVYLPDAQNSCAAKCFDAYYGDPSPLALKLFYEQKPVMIQTVT